MEDTKLKLKTQKIPLNKEISQPINKLKAKGDINSVYLFTSLSPNLNHNKYEHLSIRSVERIFRKYIKEFNYKDLKLIYYKSLMEQFPNITKIYKHKSIRDKKGINLNNIYKII